MHEETATVQNISTREQQEQSRLVQSIETGGLWEDTPTPLNNNVVTNPTEVVEKELSNQDQRNSFLI